MEVTAMGRSAAGAHRGAASSGRATSRARSEATPIAATTPGDEASSPEPDLVRPLLDPTASATSWLCPRPTDRARLLDMDRRLDSTTMHVALTASLLLAAIWLGPWAALPVAVAVPTFSTVEKLMPRVPKPEWVLIAGLLSFALSLAVAVHFTGGARSPVLVWALFMTAGVSTRFSRRGAVLVMSVLLVAMTTALITADATHPQSWLPMLVILIGAGIATSHYGQVLARAEHDYRQASQMDPLTGLLNRGALIDRFEQLRIQAAHHDSPVSLVVCDLDHFKEVNDRHGHDLGDAVLRDVAAELHSAIRSFDLIYRLGGEEFLIVLPGCELEEARSVAERIRERLRAARPGSIAITASLGVACAQGADLVFDDIFRAADQALYSAKARGRDRVAAAAAPEPAAHVLAG
jgi:diguanylate cyclase (GGDEF)-like protein